MHQLGLNCSPIFFSSLRSLPSNDSPCKRSITHGRIQDTCSLFLSNLVTISENSGTPLAPLSDISRGGTRRLLEKKETASYFTLQRDTIRGRLLETLSIILQDDFVSSKAEVPTLNDQKYFAQDRHQWR